MTREKCFACDRPFRSSARWSVKTADGQWVYVGPDCYRHVEAAGELGYQPPLGGPRLFLIPISEIK